MIGEDSDVDDKTPKKNIHNQAEEEYGVSLHAMQGTQGIHTLKLNSYLEIGREDQTEESTNAYYRHRLHPQLHFHYASEESGLGTLLAL